MFLLNILWSPFVLGKCLSIRWRKVFATFVFTFLLKGGLNQIIFRFRWRFDFWSWVGSNFKDVCLYPLFCNASSYSVLHVLNTSSFDEFCVNLLLIEDGSCFMMFGGWLDDVWMYSSLLFGFL